ncbi:MAG: pentapeptide repeat-containing protein [Rhodococcus sp. (in: high G+C Gram-positive bacteria)]
MSSKNAIPAAARPGKSIRRLTAILVGLLLLICVIAVAPKEWAALVVAVPAAWSWYLRQNITPGHGTVIGGFFVVAAAAIAYTGTHLTRTSNARHADRSHNRADLQELRRRFVTATAQFANPSPEVRLAGVYALEALTEDWIDRERYTDAQTCINYLCGYLVRPYTPPAHSPNLRSSTTRTHHTKYNYTDETHEHPRDDLNVRRAITRTIAAHLQPDHHHNWSNYDYDLTGAYFHNADFAGSDFNGTTDFSNAHFYGEKTSFKGVTFRSVHTKFDKANFACEETTFGRAVFVGDETSFVATTFRCSIQASFSGAHFRSTSLTTFSEAQFHGVQTSFNQAHFYSPETSFWATQFRSLYTKFDEANFHSKLLTNFAVAGFHSKLASFYFAGFHAGQTVFNRTVFTGEKTSFVRPRAWKNVSFDWDFPIQYEEPAAQPAYVTPKDWPPAVESKD